MTTTTDPQAPYAAPESTAPPLAGATEQVECIRCLRKMNAPGQPHHCVGGFRKRGLQYRRLAPPLAGATGEGGAPADFDRIAEILDLHAFVSLAEGQQPYPVNTYQRLRSVYIRDVADLVGCNNEQAEELVGLRTRFQEAEEAGAAAETRASAWSQALGLRIAEVNNRTAENARLIIRVQDLEADNADLRAKLATEDEARERAEAEFQAGAASGDVLLSWALRYCPQEELEYLFGKLSRRTEAGNALVAAADATESGKLALHEELRGLLRWRDPNVEMPNAGQLVELELTDADGVEQRQSLARHFGYLWFDTRRQSGRSWCTELHEALPLGAVCRWRYAVEDPKPAAALPLQGEEAGKPEACARCGQSCNAECENDGRWHDGPLVECPCCHGEGAKLMRCDACENTGKVVGPLLGDSGKEGRSNG